MCHCRTVIATSLENQTKRRSFGQGPGQGEGKNSCNVLKNTKTPSYLWGPRNDLLQEAWFGTVSLSKVSGFPSAAVCGAAAVNCLESSFKFHATNPPLHTVLKASKVGRVVCQELQKSSNSGHCTFLSHYVFPSVHDGGFDVCSVFLHCCTVVLGSVVFYFHLWDSSII